MARIQNLLSQNLNPRSHRADPGTAIVVQPSIQDPAEPPAHFPDVMLPTLAQYLSDPHLGPLDPFRNRFASQTESPLPGVRAHVCETQKVKRLRLPQSTCLPILLRKPAELHDPGLLRVQFKAELDQSLPNIPQVLLRLPLILKSDHHIIRIANDDGLAFRGVRTPFLGGTTGPAHSAGTRWPAPGRQSPLGENPLPCPSRSRLP